jgi:hypothetical protein
MSQAVYIKQINDAVKTVSALKECITSNGVEYSKLVLLGISLANQIEAIAVGLKGPQKLDLLLQILKIGIQELKEQESIDGTIVEDLLNFVESTLPFTIQAAVAVGHHGAPNLEKVVKAVGSSSCGCF